MEALTKQNGVRLLGNLKKSLKKKLKPTYPIPERKPETHIFFLARLIRFKKTKYIPLSVPFLQNMVVHKIFNDSSIV
jgi:hypothetical protein